MTFYSLFQPPLLLLAIGLVILVLGTPSETGPGMMEVKEDRFVCLACQARHFPAVYSSRRARALRVYTLIILCIYNVYLFNIQCISETYIV